MKPPKPTEGVARHCWGKRRRAAKKIEKGIWKAMDRLGILRKSHIKAEDCSLEEVIWKGYNYDAMQGRMPEPIAKSDRHALQLLRKEIRDRKHRTQAPGQRGEG